MKTGYQSNMYKTISWNTGRAAERARYNLKLNKKRRPAAQAASSKRQAGGLDRQANREKTWLPQNPWYKVIMSRSLKPEFRPGGAERQYILDKAVEYILDPKFGTQNAKHAFLLEQVGLSSTEYLECLNRATNGGVVKAALWNSD